MNSESIDVWFELVNRILLDSLPDRVDLTFLHAETEDNESSSFRGGAKLYSEGFTPKIGITLGDQSIFEEMCEKYEKVDPALAKKIRKNVIVEENGSIAGYRGFRHWKKNLTELGVAEDDILLIEPSYDCYFCTDGEARGLIDFCTQQGIEDVCITAPPFHQVRAYLSDVSALLQKKATNLRLYSRPGEQLDWGEEIIHSQGVERGKRKDILRGEFERICKYQESGSPPLVSLREVLTYLNRRD